MLVIYVTLELNLSEKLFPWKCKMKIGIQSNCPGWIPTSSAILLGPSKNIYLKNSYIKVGFLHAVHLETLDDGINCI